ncbi:hypothetical protein BV25DRAFT_1823066 [Artomyces pyxidatus]|uniref:Uncharacterized protein n=1 Tax=Artomyces pyxidatus TaxID=48021 RepID=A0ACB8T922_9AGAM|nr:hypothetical protein BV25DRAFT_1823066 [Artomyces pyxidatus]
MPASASHLLSDHHSFEWPSIHPFFTGPATPTDTEHDPSPLHQPASLPAMAISLPSYHPVFHESMHYIQHPYSAEPDVYSSADFYFHRATTAALTPVAQDMCLLDSGPSPQGHLSRQHDHDEILSPASVQSFLSTSQSQLSPSHSPTELLSPHTLPSPTPLPSMHAVPLQKNGALQSMLHPEEQMFNFTDATHVFPKRAKAPQAFEIDPYAAAFLQEQIGDEKWGIFAARLYERRLGGPKARARGKTPKAPPTRPDHASALDFLVKVEVVKEVLRVFVPHPYNPFKSLTHPYACAPSGIVTLTRATILALSGWSNTQFSYWARRAEAICVLAPHDPTLHAVAIALERRLHPPAPPSSLSCSPLTSPVSSNASFGSTECDPPEPVVTGKGLDQLIDSVKRRTGHSPFLRGKHASLDAFGVPGGDRDAPPAAAPVYQPTFQAQMYAHEARPGSRKRRRRDSGSGDSEVSVPGEGTVPIKVEADIDGAVHVSLAQDAERHARCFRTSDSRDLLASPAAVVGVKRSLPDEVSEDASAAFWPASTHFREGASAALQQLARERGARKRARTGN